MTDLVLTCTLMIYAEGSEMPLPTQEEVLICTPQTTAEEVQSYTIKLSYLIVFLGYIAMEKSDR